MGLLLYVRKCSQEQSLKITTEENTHLRDENLKIINQLSYQLLLQAWQWVRYWDYESGNMKARQNRVGSQMLKKTGNFNYDKCCKGRHGAMSPHGGFVAAMKRWSAS